MNKNIKVVLSPDVHQVQHLLNTMNRYNELCNYISKIVYESDDTNPTNLYYWRVDYKYDNLYHELRDKFSDLNSNFIPLALNKVAKAYGRNTYSEARRFTGFAHYNKYLLSIKFISPEPFNMGMITISTLSGRQQIHFMFDHSQRNELYSVLSSKRYREYRLDYIENQFYLKIYAVNDQIEPSIQSIMPDYQDSFAYIN